MNEDEKNIIIDLLLKKYKKTKNEKLLELAKKVHNANWVVKDLRFDYCEFETEKGNKDVIFDFSNPYIEEIAIQNKKIKVCNRFFYL